LSPPGSVVCAETSGHVKHYRFCIQLEEKVIER
jgi:hypothetical protein